MPEGFGVLLPIVSAAGLRSELWEWLYLFGLAFLSRRGWAEQPLQGLGRSIISSARTSWLFQPRFPVGFSSGAGHFSGGAGAEPGCIAVNDPNSEECSEREQKGSRAACLRNGHGR